MTDTPTQVDDDGLGDALLARFLTGVREDGWKVIALGNSASLADLGVDPSLAVILVAERPDRKQTR